jgi:predicted RecA/RadA family phage recombinase
VRRRPEHGQRRAAGHFPAVGAEAGVERPHRTGIGELAPVAEVSIPRGATKSTLLSGVRALPRAPGPALEKNSVQSTGTLQAGAFTQYAAPTALTFGNNG